MRRNACLRSNRRGPALRCLEGIPCPAAQYNAEMEMVNYGEEVARAVSYQMQLSGG